MDKLRLETGLPAPSPVINAWLNPSAKGFELVLKHSDDAGDQRLFFFDLRDGKVEISMQALFGANLCHALGITKGETPTIRPFGERLAPANTDALKQHGFDAVVEALGPGRDWAMDAWLEARDAYTNKPTFKSGHEAAAAVIKSRARPIVNDIAGTCPDCNGLGYIGGEDTPSSCMNAWHQATRAHPVVNDIVTDEFLYGAVMKMRAAGAMAQEKEVMRALIKEANGQ